MKHLLLIVLAAIILTGCRSSKKEEAQKEIHYELVTTLRDSLVITHEKKETITERVIEKSEEKKEKADNYKRTDKDGTVHEFSNYNTEVKTDEKVSENIKELTEKYSQLELKFSELQEKYNELEKLSKKEKDFDFGSVLWILFGICVVAGIIYLYRKFKL
ncbi:hypothetical protein [Flavobacterium sp. I3-2]|uniref:hypothetical protein n=1 Tax=Flavobacterium sp. I3-2 TaxID=2748319 RepID=UPI0015AE8403|nr:hypothetical protein [Flavobacterium sp. I3-2]